MIRRILSFIGGAIVASMLVTATGTLWAGLLASVVAAVAKEAFDYYYKKKEPDWFDMLAVVAGGLSSTFGLFFWL